MRHRVRRRISASVLIASGLALAAMTFGAALVVAQITLHTVHIPALPLRVATGFMSGADAGVAIQNLDTVAEVDVATDFTAHNGGLEQTINLDPIAAESAGNIWLPGTTLRAGTYALAVHGDRPVAALARIDWPTSRAAAMDGHATPSTRVQVPLVARGFHGQCSYVAVKNTDAQNETTVEFIARASGSLTPTATGTLLLLPGSATALDFCGESDGLPSLPESFLGSAEFVADHPIAVQAFIRTGGQSKSAVYSFGGRPAGDADNILYVPLFRARQPVAPSNPSAGRLDTGISVANPGESPVDVTMEYFGADHPGAGVDCRGRRFLSPEVRIPAGSSHVFYQGSPASQNLPDGCFGSAVVRATGGNVLAIVNDALNDGETAAAYNAFTEADGATRTALPLFRRRHAGGLSTGISVMNVGTVRAEVRVEYTPLSTDWNPAPVVCPTHCVASVAPNASAFFWPPSTDGLEDGTYGSAVINSTQPVVVIVNDVTPDGGIDMATYSGIGVE